MSRRGGRGGPGPSRLVPPLPEAEWTVIRQVKQSKH